uniref:Uncharacterized protein n=1 Tax=Parascaris equorum TaxID=6256 RepID=A0A914RN23_PAREQ
MQLFQWVNSIQKPCKYRTVADSDTLMIDNHATIILIGKMRLADSANQRCASSEGLYVYR